MIKFFSSSALIAVISSLFRSAILYAFWVFLPVFLPTVELDILAYNYALSFSLIGLLDMGGVSNVALTKIGSSKYSENNKSLGITVVILQLFSLILILAFLHLLIDASSSFVITLIGVFSYFVLWASIKKITENTKKNQVVYFFDVITVTISVIGVLLLSRIIQNSMISFVFSALTSSILYVFVFRKKTNLFVLDLLSIFTQIKYLMSLNWPLLLSSFGVFLVILVEREFLSSIQEGPERPYQYVLTVILQISQLFVVAFQGLYNRIWHYEASKSNDLDSVPRYINLVSNVLNIVSPIGFFIAIYLLPNIYSISFSKQELFLAGIIGTLALAVQLITVKVGSLGLFKSMGTYSIVSVLVNLMAMSMVYYFVSNGLQGYGLELLLIKYIIVSIFQLIYLAFVLKKSFLPGTKFISRTLVKNIISLFICLCVIYTVSWVYAILAIVIHLLINRKSNYRSLIYILNV